MITDTQKQTLVALYDQGAKALTSGNTADKGRAALMITEALNSLGLTSEDCLDIAEEALLRNGNHKYQYAPETEPYVPYADELDEFESELTDEDYIAGWGLTRSEVIGEQDYPDYMSTWDSNDYEYNQTLVYN